MDNGRMRGRMRALMLAATAVTLPLHCAGSKPIQRVSLPSAIRQLYSNLAECWKTTLPVRARLLSDHEMNVLVRHTGGSVGRSKGGDSEVDGCYQANVENADTAATISIRRSLTPQAGLLVFAHEYGHFVWDEQLDNVQKDDFVLMWKSDKLARHLITDYASDSPEEGFAEAFSYYICAQGILRRREPAAATYLCKLQDQLSSRKRSVE